MGSGKVVFEYLINYRTAPLVPKPLLLDHTNISDCGSYHQGPQYMNIHFHGMLFSPMLEKQPLRSRAPQNLRLTRAADHHQVSTGITIIFHRFLIFYDPSLYGIIIVEDTGYDITEVRGRGSY
jgi:hypothetical protein